jgi:hypothetical protein
MIVRVQGSGQFEIDEGLEHDLTQIDNALVAAVNRSDTDAAHTLLGQAIALVAGRGHPLAPDDLRSSDLVLPPADATLEETHAILASEGLLA